MSAQIQEEVLVLDDDVTISLGCVDKCSDHHLIFVTLLMFSAKARVHFIGFVVADDCGCEKNMATINFVIFNFFLINCLF